MIKEFLENLFRHKHRFDRYRGFVYHASKINALSALPCTAAVYSCRCGVERRVLTDAGRQQNLWGDDMYELYGISENYNPSSCILVG